jgi:hypothetical protein
VLLSGGPVLQLVTRDELPSFAAAALGGNSLFGGVDA